MKSKEILGFVFALENECLHAKMAYADLEKHLATQAHDRIWYSLSALLRAVADISKIFWPQNKKNYEHQRRGRELRERFSIPDDSPLCSRDMRNRIDHSDEYFQEWMKSHVAFQRMGTNYGPATMLPLNAPWLGFFDAPTKTILFLDVTWQITPVMEAIDDLLSKVKKDIPQLMKNAGNNGIGVREAENPWSQ